MELLTNQTTLGKMFAYDSTKEPMLHIGFAFNTPLNYFRNETHMTHRNYI